MRFTIYRVLSGIDKATNQYTFTTLRGHPVQYIDEVEMPMSRNPKSALVFLNQSKYGVVMPDSLNLFFVTRPGLLAGGSNGEKTTGYFLYDGHEVKEFSWEQAKAILALAK